MLKRFSVVRWSFAGVLVFSGLVFFQVPPAGASCSDVGSCIKDLESDDPSLQGQAIFKLGTFQSREATGALIRVVGGDADDGIRRSAIQALGNLGDPKAVPALVPLMKDGVFRREVIGALVQIKDQTAVDALIGGLKDSETQLASAQALGELAEPSAKPALVRLIRSTQDERVLGVATLAVQKINSYWGPTEEEMGLPIYPQADYIPNPQGDWVFMVRASVADVSGFYQEQLGHPVLDFAGFVNRYEKGFAGEGKLKKEPEAVIVAREQTFEGKKYPSVLIFINKVRKETEIRIFHAQGGDED